LTTSDAAAPRARPQLEKPYSRDSELRLVQGGEFTDRQPAAGFQLQEAKAGLIGK
jgi:hypothetical protein